MVPDVAYKAAVVAYVNTTIDALYSVLDEMDGVEDMSVGCRYYVNIVKCSAVPVGICRSRDQ